MRRLRMPASAVLLATAATTALAAPARGPFRVNPDNPRYFTDGPKNPGESSAPST